MLHNNYTNYLLQGPETGNNAKKGILKFFQSSLVNQLLLLPFLQRGEQSKNIKGVLTVAAVCKLP